MSFSFICKASALYQGNPASCELPIQGIVIPEERAVSFKLGYQVEKVFNREMEPIHAPNNSGSLDDKISSFFNQGVLTFNIIDRLELFTTLGTMQLSVKQAFFRAIEIQAESKNSFAGSIGGRALLLFWGDTSLGVVASYLFSHPNLDQLMLNKIAQRVDHSSLHYNEWQVQLALSHKVSIFSFYLGGAYSYVEMKLKLPRHTISVGYKNQRKISAVLGSSIFAKKGLTANVEAKLFGETSLGGSVDLRF